MKKYEGVFEIWRYDVSHAKLILRRNKTAQNETRLNICFFNTKFVCLQTSFYDLTIKEIKFCELAAGIYAGSENADLVFCLIDSKNQPGYVVCGAIELVEDNFAYFEPTPFD